jgi:hypothetical protein
LRDLERSTFLVGCPGASRCSRCPALVWEIVDAFAGSPLHNAKVRQLRIRLGQPPVYARGQPYIAPAMSRVGPGTAGLTFRF